MGGMIDSTLQQTQAARDRHGLNATSKLLSALHYHRFFGQPIDAFSPRHNATRKESNDRHIAALALQAGQSARYSGRDCAEWEALCPEAWGIDEIRQAMLVGWAQTDADLISCTDVVDSGSVAS